MLSEVSQRKTNTVRFYIWKLKQSNSQKQRPEWWFLEDGKKWGSYSLLEDTNKAPTAQKAWDL